MPLAPLRPETKVGRQWLWSIAGFHLLTRLLTIGALAIAAARVGHPLSWAVTAFDGQWYQRLTANGYPHTLPTIGSGAQTTVVASTAAFFPLFALVLRPFTAIGVPFWLAALLFVTVVSTAAAVLIGMVTKEYTNARVGRLTAFCWSVFPTSGLLSVAYSEALFTALAAGCLLCLFRRWWWWGGILAALAGATRPTGVIVVAAVGVAVLLAIVKERDYSSVAAAVVAPLGTIGTLLWIGLRTGRLDAWFVTESQGWEVHFDAGRTLLGWAVDAARGRHGVVGVVYILVLLGALALAVAAAVNRPPPAVLIYLVLGTVLAIGQGGKFHLSGLRFLLPVFPILVPGAQLLNRSGRLGTALTLALALAASVALACYYFTVGTAPP